MKQLINGNDIIVKITMYHIFVKKKFVKQAPKIRPNKYNWDYKEEYYYDDACVDTVDHNDHIVFKKEFERFWWNYVWFNNEQKKQQYLKRFSNTCLGDIRLILFEKDISTILRSQVGITSRNDIKYILDAINIYQKEYKKFKQWLNSDKIKIDKEYQLLIEKHAIYTFDTFYYKIKSIRI